MTRRAGELAALCADVSTPGLSFGSQTERLTRREREVASMAAAGASSRLAGRQLGRKGGSAFGIALSTPLITALR